MITLTTTPQVSFGYRVPYGRVFQEKVANQAKITQQCNEFSQQAADALKTYVLTDIPGLLKPQALGAFVDYAGNIVQDVKLEKGRAFHPNGDNFTGFFHAKDGKVINYANGDLIKVIKDNKVLESYNRVSMKVSKGNIKVLDRSEAVEIVGYNDEGKVKKITTLMFDSQGKVRRKIEQSERNTAIATDFKDGARVSSSYYKNGAFQNGNIYQYNRVKEYFETDPSTGDLRIITHQSPDVLIEKVGTSEHDLSNQYISLAQHRFAPLKRYLATVNVKQGNEFGLDKGQVVSSVQKNVSQLMYTTDTYSYEIKLYDRSSGDVMAEVTYEDFLEDVSGTFIMTPKRKIPRLNEEKKDKLSRLSKCCEKLEQYYEKNGILFPFEKMRKVKILENK